jgi:hypothetical protein
VQGKYLQNSIVATDLRFSPTESDKLGNDFTLSKIVSKHILPLTLSVDENCKPLAIAVLEIVT